MSLELLIQEAKKNLDESKQSLEALQNIKKGSTKKTSRPTNVSLAVGQHITYKQGRGTFSATIESIDGKTLTCIRTSDGKRITRPASKVF